MLGAGPGKGRIARLRSDFCASAVERMQTVVMAKKIFFIRRISFLKRILNTKFFKEPVYFFALFGR